MPAAVHFERSNPKHQPVRSDGPGRIRSAAQSIIIKEAHPELRAEVLTKIAPAVHQVDPFRPWHVQEAIVVVVIRGLHIIPMHQQHGAPLLP